MRSQRQHWRMRRVVEVILGEARAAEGCGELEAFTQMGVKSNVVEQDHRGVKRVTRPMLGVQSFAAAQDTLVGIALMHMLKKRQMVVEAGDEGLTAAELFYSLAA